MDYVVKLLQLESERKMGLKINPKLTRKHVLVNSFSKMKVKLFSQKTATAFLVYTTTKDLPEECLHMADFFRKIDNMFDSCNSSHMHDSKPFRKFITTKSDHIRFMKECVKMFENLQVKDARADTVPCIQGWIQSLTGLIQLWNYLQTKFHVDHLFTRHRII